MQSTTLNPTAIATLKEIVTEAKANLAADVDNAYSRIAAMGTIALDGAVNPPGFWTGMESDMGIGLCLDAIEEEAKALRDERMLYAVDAVRAEF